MKHKIDQGQIRSLACAVLLICALFSNFAQAHGEDKPGPHGGEIKMPGAFHTEVLLRGKNHVRVYLLDMDWKNPSVTDSKVEVSHLLNSGGKTKRQHAKCLKKNNFYLCRFLKDVDLTQGGSLQVTAQREKQKGNAVTYNLPLRFNGQEKGDSNDHSGHGDHSEH